MVLRVLRKRFGKQRQLASAVSLLVTAILCLAWSFWPKRDSYYINRVERIAFLVDELTTSPERQQRALDEIVKDESGAFIYLLKYVDDRRPLAREEALFLNTHPNTFERYFQAGGKRVGETILRYLCWKTDSCDVGFRSEDAKATEIQIQKINRYCRENFKDPDLYRN